MWQISELCCENVLLRNSTVVKSCCYETVLLQNRLLQDCALQDRTAAARPHIFNTIVEIVCCEIIVMQKVMRSNWANSCCKIVVRSY